MKAVIFDFDGVLVESEPLLIDIEIEVLNQHGIPLTVEIASEYLGLKLVDYIAALNERFEVNLDVDLIAKNISTRNIALYEETVPLVTHAYEILEAVSATHRLVLATSRERDLAIAAMERLNISQFFSKGVFKEDVVKGKPDPEVFLKAATLVEVEPGECIVVEDAQNGFKAAKAAGMQVIARKAEHNEQQDFSLADYVVEDLREIESVIH